MSAIYCINPSCKHRHQEESTNCSYCHNPLLIQEKYRLLEPLRQLDERGNTEIFEVDDARGTLKVLKVLQDPKNPKLLSMFEREARTLQRLQHSGIPSVEPDGYFTFVLNNGKKLHCLVMEKFAGQNLEQWLKENKPIRQAEAVNWLIEILSYQISCSNLTDNWH